MQHPFFSTINWEDIYNKRVSSLYFRKVNVNLTYQIHVRVYVTSHPSSYPSFDHQFSTLVPTKQHRILISLGATTLAKKCRIFGWKWNGTVIFQKICSEIVHYFQRENSFFCLEKNGGNSLYHLLKFPVSSFTSAKNNYGKWFWKKKTFIMLPLFNSHPNQFVLTSHKYPRLILSQPNLSDLMRSPRIIDFLFLTHPEIMRFFADQKDCRLWGQEC